LTLSRRDQVAFTFLLKMLAIGSASGAHSPNMRLNFFQLFCAAVLGASLSQANATTMTYTESAVVNGSLGGMAFYDANVTITTIADTANILTMPYGSDSGSLHLLLGTTTASISGLGVATLLAVDGYQYGAYSITYPAYDITWEVGIARVNADFSAGKSILDNSELYASGQYTLSTPALFTAGRGSVQPDMPLSTDLGTLILTSFSPSGERKLAGVTTFTATSFSPVPEPSEWAAISFALLGVVWLAKRRFAPAAA
jgi:hypothetical protein